MWSTHRDLDHSVSVSRIQESCYCFDYVLYSLSYVGSRDLVRQRPAVHNQDKQRFLNETFKTRCTNPAMILKQIVDSHLLKLNDIIYNI